MGEMKSENTVEGNCAAGFFPPLLREVQMSGYGSIALWV